MTNTTSKTRWIVVGQWIDGGKQSVPHVGWLFSCSLDDFDKFISLWNESERGLNTVG